MHTLGRCVFEFTVISRAISSGALESNTTCTLPAPVSITGTVELVTTVSMRFADPRGTSTSMRPRAVIIAFAPTRPNSSTVWIASGSTPHDRSASRMMSTSTVFDDAAALPPRRTTALPERSASDAMSTVTFGRAS